MNLARTKPAPGVSLLEVILALAILGTSLGVLSQIMSTGVDAGKEASELAVCRMVCAQRLATLLIDVDAGITPTPLFDTPVQDLEQPSSRNLSCDIEVQPGVLSGVLNLRVTVRSMSATGESPLASASLTRWIVDPALGLEELEAEMEAAAAEAAGESGEDEEG